MAKILVLYYSGYGHIETMANAIAEGAGSDNKRQPSENELTIAHKQGKHVAEITVKLFG